MSVNTEWERWHKSLRHDEVKSIGDAVEQLMYEVIEFGGDMGPNGNTYNGIDEGDVLTAGYINEWVERFENMLGPGTCEWCADGKFDGQTVMMSNHGWQRINYCPNCGRKMKED